MFKHVEVMYNSESFYLGAIFWLVVNGCHQFLIFPEILGCDHHPKWRSPIFQRGGPTTNQWYHGYMVVSWNRGTPSHHPLLDGILHYNKPSDLMIAHLWTPPTYVYIYIYIFTYVWYIILVGDLYQQYYVDYTTSYDMCMYNIFMV